MTDEAHDWTDEQIAALESRMSTAYEQAASEMSDKLAQFLADFDERNEEMKSRLASGKVTQDEYDRWLEFQSTRQVWINKMAEELAVDATKTDQLAMSYINDELPKVYCENVNHSFYGIEKEIGFDTHSFTLYDQKTVGLLLADPDAIRYPSAGLDETKDSVWNFRKMNEALTQSILQGESIPNTAKRIMSVVDMDKRVAARVARTTMTSAENAGRVESYRVADKAGVRMHKQWMSTIDVRTRYSHRLMNGVHVPYNKPFIVGPNEAEMMHPADPQGPAEEVYNCRCTLVGWVQGIEAEDPEQWTNLPEGMTYEQWLKKAQDWSDEVKKAKGEEKSIRIESLKSNLSSVEKELEAANSVRNPYRGSEEYYKSRADTFKAKRDALKHTLDYDEDSIRNESMSIEKEMDVLSDKLWGDNRLKWSSQEYDAAEEKYWELDKRANKLLDMLQEIKDYRSYDESYRESIKRYEDEKKNNAPKVKAYEEAQARIPSLMKQRNAALRELSTAMPFGDTIVDEVGKDFVDGLERTIEAARERHPEIVDAFRMFQSKFKVVDAEHKDGAYYQTSEQGIYFNARADAKGSKRGGNKFETVTHEFGHMIDNESTADGYRYWSATDEFQNAIKKDWTKFRDSIARRDKVRKDKNDYAIKVLKTEKWELDQTEDELGLTTYSRVSDIIEGCTKKSYPLGFGHGASYHKNMKNSTCTEFVAEYFDSALTNELAHEQMRRIFPTACGMVDDFVKELLS